MRSDGWTCGGHRRRHRDERGSSAVELALLVPALALLLGLVVGGGRLWFARTTVQEAAQTSSRSASLARTAGQASADGAAAARASLATAGLDCGDQSVALDTTAFSVPVGSPATVRSTVVCAVSFADILLPGMPGAIRVTASETSALDTYRSRSR